MIRRGALDDGMRRLKQAVELGYGYPHWLTSDPWFEPAHRHPDFPPLLALVEAELEEALDTFASAGGDRVLGRVVTD